MRKMFNGLIGGVTFMFTILALMIGFFGALLTGSLAWLLPACIIGVCGITIATLTHQRA